MFEGRSRKKRGGLVVNARCMTITECVYDLDGSCMNEVAEKQDTQTLNCCKAYFSVNWHPLRPSWRRCPQRRDFGYGNRISH
jgi:hypothetical protein